MTIYQIYTNGIPTKHVFNNQAEADQLCSKLKYMYRTVSVESFEVPTTEENNTTEEVTIEQLQNKKTTLLSQFDAMAKAHAKLYAHLDISEPKSENEKISEKQKADLYSEISETVKQIRALKTR